MGCCESKDTVHPDEKNTERKLAVVSVTNDAIYVDGEEKEDCTASVDGEEKEDCTASVYRPCSMLRSNPKLRHRKDFHTFCSQALKDGLQELHCNDEAKQCWMQIINGVEAEIGLKFNENVIKTEFDSKEDDAAGALMSDTADSDNEDDDDRWNSGNFWEDITTNNNKIFDFFDNKLADAAVTFISAVLHHITRTLNKIERVPIAVEQLFQLLGRLPVLRHILPKGTVIDVVPNPGFSFNNWGLTQQSNPEKMEFLRTKDEIIEFVREASSKKKRVRVSVYAHSWSPMFSDTGDYHAKLLPDKFTRLYPEDIPLQFNADFTEVYVEGYPLMYCRLNFKNNRIIVGASTPTIMYVKLVEKRFQNNLFTFPAEFANTIQLHQSFVGTHAISCHGSGIETTVITNYIRRLNVINWEGEEVVYEGKEILDKIGCHFGLLGIVTEMELQFRDTYYALYWPRFVKYEEFMPETGECKALQEDVEQNYYNEYFWWPQTDEIYVNSFKITDNPSNASIHPTDFERALQQFMTQAIQLIYTLFPRIKAHGWMEKMLAKLVAVLAHSALDTPDDVMKIPGPNGLHFRYGIQNFRMLDTEWVFPLPGIDSAETGKRVPDMRVARDLFWENRKLAEEWAGKGIYPQLQPCEMRIIRGGGNVALTWGKGCEFVCAIEILTSIADDKVNDVWYKYSQEMVNRWMAVIEKHMGSEALMLCKPHWGKEWENIEIKGKSIYHHLRTVYREDIQIFDEIRREADPNNMFMNKSWERIFGISRE